MSGDKEKVGGKLVRFKKSEPDFLNIKPDVFQDEHIAVFIHGFTANSKYLAELMGEFEAHGFVALAFDYPSYGGIDKAANELADLLAIQDTLSGGVISKKKNLVLVCHSMGGLVARAFIGMCDGGKFVRKVVTLGTPHDATLSQSTSIPALLSWGERISGITKGGYSSSSRSALQLMKKDQPEPLLDQLLTAPPCVPNVRFLSISGGLPWLDFGSNALYTKLVNAAIQWRLGGGANDGLVLEASSDFSREKFRPSFPCCEPHVGTGHYERYTETNHTYLINTQVVALKAIAFAKANP